MLDWTLGKKCDVCESRLDTATEGRHTLCGFHGKMQASIVDLVKKLRAEDRLLTMAEYDELRMNSYDRGALVSLMDNALLVSQIQITLKNCSRIKRPPCTYDEAIQIYARMAAYRLRDPKSTENVDGA